MADKKERFKMYKAGKQWMVSGLFSMGAKTDGEASEVARPVQKRGQQWLLASATAVGMFTGGVTVDNNQHAHNFVQQAIVSVMGIEKAAAAVVNSTIDTVTDADGTNRSVARTDGNDIKNNASLLGSAAWQNNTGLANNEQYVTLTTGQNQTGYEYLNQQFAGTQTWTIQGHLSPERLASQGNNTGDWLGIIIAPTDPKNMVNGYAGGGLGIRNVPNALAWGIDMYYNADMLDPAAAPVAGWRWTGSDGSMQGTGSENVFSKDDVRNWSLGSTGLSYKITWTPSSDGKTGTITGWFYDSSGNQKFTASRTINNPGYFSVALNASTGSSYQKMTGSITVVNGTVNYAPVTVKYIDGSGNTLKTSTSMNANVGETIGVTGLSPNAATDTYSYNPAVITGYYAKSATDATSSTSTAGVVTITYAKENQTARLLTDATDPSGAKTVEAASGTSGSTIALSSTDANLSRSGYNYTVKGPDGKIYATLADAKAAGVVYDNTVNNGSTTDATTQDYTVTYTKSPQQAIVKNIDASGTQEVANGFTGDKISFNVTDAVLAQRLGYNYTVTGPGGKQWDTLAAAIAGNSIYDSTNNATGATDSTPQVFTINWTPAYQEVNISVKNPVDNTTTVEKVTGVTAATIAAKTTDASLQKQGYTYEVTGPNGVIYKGSNALAQALADVKGVFDATPNSKADSASNIDAVIQTFTVTYTPLPSTVTYNYVDDKGKTIAPSSTATGVTGGTIAENQLTIPGYTFKAKDASSDADMLYDASGSSTVTYVYTPND
ncbi:MAG TPA: MucBP domain-containing protein [Lactobacillaceae bacterium]|jgi:hypothetical protein